MIVKRKKCILPRAVKFLQHTGALQIIHQRIDELLRLCTDLSESHRIIEETAFHVMRRKLRRMEIDDRLSHIRKVKLDPGVICHHQACLRQQLLVIALCRREKLHISMHLKIILLRTDDRMQ